MNKRQLFYLPGILFLLLTFFPLQADEIELDLLTDSILSGSALTLAVTGYILLHNQEIPRDYSLDPAGINAFDRGAYFAYAKELSVVSDFTQYGTALLPGLLCIGIPTGEILEIGLLYTETLGFAYAAKNILKFFVTRYRPFMYHEGVSPELTEDSDFINSLPSGHTTMTFAAAAFGAYMFHFYHPGSPLEIPFIAGSFGLAALTATLRVLSGNHFLSDVLAGAAIGTAVGIIIPLVHRKMESKDDKIRLSISPGRIAFILKK